MRLRKELFLGAYPIIEMVQDTNPPRAPIGLPRQMMPGAKRH